MLANKRRYENELALYEYVARSERGTRNDVDIKYADGGKKLNEIRRDYELDESEKKSHSISHSCTKALEHIRKTSHFD